MTLINQGGFIMDWVLDHTKQHHRFFEELTRIPHGSYNEAQYGNYLENFAIEHNFEYYRDEIGNVIIYKRGSKGYETHPYVALQAHMDMVCEKDENVVHDFEKDPLKLYIEDGYLKARGTTLGADDGTGVAYILAILDDEEAQHPPIEAIFTVQEEVGLGGALALKPESIRSRQFISLDCGGGDSIYISSLGGHRGRLSRTIKYESTTEKGYLLEVSGLLGGYSTGYADEQRNANNLTARILWKLNCMAGIRLVSIEGGKEENKISTECKVLFTSAVTTETVHNIIQRESMLIKKEIEPAESQFQVQLKDVKVQSHLMEKDSLDLLRLMYLFPCGLRHKSSRFPEIMSECVNWSIVHTKDEEFSLVFVLRGTADSIVENMHSEILLLGEMFGMKDEILSAFPAWEYHDSQLLKTLKKVFYDNTGKELGLIPVQGGLECGVFARMHPDMDIIAMGPYGYDVHTTSERMDLENFDSLFVIFKKLLAAL